MRRCAVSLSWLTSVLSAVAVAGAVRGVREGDIASPAFYFMMLLPIGISAGGVIASYQDRMGPMWASVGAMFGWAVVTMWSVGLFFLPSAVLLFLAATAHASAIRSRWWTLTFPLWIAAGAFSIPVVYLAMAFGQRLLGQGVLFPGETREFEAGTTSIHTVAEFVVAGSWFFSAAMLALSAVHLSAVSWRQFRHRPWLAAAGILLVLGVGAALESLVIDRAIGELRRGGTSCWSSGERTVCASE